MIKLINTIFYKDEVKSLRNYQDYYHNKLTQKGEPVPVHLLSLSRHIPARPAWKPTIMWTQSPIWWGKKHVIFGAHQLPIRSINWSENSTDTWLLDPERMQWGSLASSWAETKGKKPTCCSNTLCVMWNHTLSHSILPAAGAIYKVTVFSALHWHFATSDQPPRCTGITENTNSGCSLVLPKQSSLAGMSLLARFSNLNHFNFN